MSSLIRRLQRAVMRKAGYKREPFKIGKNADGLPRLIDVRRGGIITDANDDAVGYNWPLLIPRGIVPVARKVRRLPARGSRRGKPNKAFIALRAHPVWQAA